MEIPNHRLETFCSNMRKNPLAHCKRCLKSSQHQKREDDSNCQIDKCKEESVYTKRNIVQNESNVGIPPQIKKNETVLGSQSQRGKQIGKIVFSKNHTKKNWGGFFQVSPQSNSTPSQSKQDDEKKFQGFKKKQNLIDYNIQQKDNSVQLENSFEQLNLFEPSPIRQSNNQIQSDEQVRQPKHETNHAAKNKNKVGNIIAIDFGTVHCSIACVENDFMVLSNNKRIPNAVAFSKQREKLVGIEALRLSIISPENAVLGIKKFMGMNYDDLVLQDRIRNQTFKIVKRQSNQAQIEIMGKYSPSLIGSYVIMKLKQEVERHLEETVNRAIISVPAFFNHYQCQAILNAAKLAGFQVQSVIAQNLAAAMRFYRQNEKKFIAVYDFGQRFDFSIIKQEGYAQTKAIVGDHTIGGSEIDKIIQNFFVQQFQSQTGLDISSDKMALQMLRQAAEKAKIQLSSQPQTFVVVPRLAADALEPKHFALKFTRTNLEAMAQDILRKTIQLCEKCILEAKISKEQISEVILVGGMANMPKVVELVEECFGKSCHVDSYGGVVFGTALYASKIKDSLKKMNLIQYYTFSNRRAYQDLKKINIPLSDHLDLPVIIQEEQ